MKKNFLLWNVVEKKSMESIKELTLTMQQLQKSENSIVIKSLFVYGISTFENVMTDILREFCKAFPEKIPSKEILLSKEQILNDTEVIVEIFLDNSINKLTYGSLEKYISEFTKLLAIDMIPDVSKLIEIKETRNLIMHNNLIVNSIYLTKCKNDCVRATEKDINKKLPFDKEYAYKSLKLCVDVLNENILVKLKDKYGSFTKIKAMEEIWNELFNSPILKFNEYWEYDNNGNLLGFINKDIETYFYNGYSTTEKMLMGKIMMHYWGSLQNIERINIDLFNTDRMYGDRKVKFLYLQDILFRYPQLFEQDSRLTEND